MYSYHLTDGTTIVDGNEASRILAGLGQVEFVSAVFCPAIPKSWAALGSEEERNWAALPPSAIKTMIADLRTAIQKGEVENLWLSLEPWGEDCALNVDFENGWAALLYNSAGECAASLYTGRSDGAEDAPVNIGGQTPVPKMCASEDLEQVAEAVAYFLETGRFHPDMQWAVLEGGDLPWTEE